MQTPLEPRVIVVTKNADVAAIVSRWAETTQVQPSIQCLSSAGMAVARVAGGDVNAVVLDPAIVAGERLEKLIDELRSTRPRTRLIVAALGGSGSLPIPRQVAVCGTSHALCNELTRVLGDKLRRSPPESDQSRKAGGQATGAIGFLGAKGGVGTTTVALNTACVLATTGHTGIVEVGASPHTLGLRCGARRIAKQRSGPGRADPESLLSVKEFPMLRIVETSNSNEFTPEMSADSIANSVEQLKIWAQFVVVDLGSALTRAVREVLPALDTVNIVSDRNPLSMECARRCASALSSVGLGMGPGAVIVNRSALACPPEVRAFESATGMPVIGVIPPASDLCCAADSAGRPLVGFDPDSLAAQALFSLAHHVAGVSRR